MRKIDEIYQSDDLDLSKEVTSFNLEHEGNMEFGNVHGLVLLIALSIPEFSMFTIAHSKIQCQF